MQVDEGDERGTIPYGGSVDEGWRAVHQFAAFCRELRRRDPEGRGLMLPDDVLEEIMKLRFGSGPGLCRKGGMPVGEVEELLRSFLVRMRVVPVGAPGNKDAARGNGIMSTMEDGAPMGGQFFRSPERRRGQIQSTIGSQRRENPSGSPRGPSYDREGRYETRGGFPAHNQPTARAMAEMERLNDGIPDDGGAYPSHHQPTARNIWKKEERIDSKDHVYLRPKYGQKLATMWSAPPPAGMPEREELDESAPGNRSYGANGEEDQGQDATTTTRPRPAPTVEAMIALVDYEALIDALRPRLSQNNRKLLVRKFAQLVAQDPNAPRTKKLSMTALKSAFRPMHDPRVLRRQCGAQAVLDDFVLTFDVASNRTGSVSETSFLKYYAVPATVLNSLDFEHVVRQCWDPEEFLDHILSVSNPDAAFSVRVEFEDGCAADIALVNDLGIDRANPADVIRGGNMLAYPHQTGFRPVSDQFQTGFRPVPCRMHSPCHSVISVAQSMLSCHVRCTVMSDAQCHVGCTALTEIHESSLKVVRCWYGSGPLMFGLCVSSSGDGEGPAAGRGRGEGAVFVSRDGGEHLAGREIGVQYC